MKLNNIWILALIFIIAVGVCGCMNISSNKSNRKESDQEYVALMQKYIQDKYSVTVTVVEQILPRDGINTGLKENILVVRDANGVIANVKAKLSTPYAFYDNYIESCTAARIQEELNIKVSAGKAKIYVVVNNDDISKIDTSVANVASLTFVSMIADQPSDEILEELYKNYSRIQEKGYENVYFLVGFTDGSEAFDKAVENYLIHGKPGWKDYSGSVFAEIYVTENELSFEDFIKNLR